MTSYADQNENPPPLGPASSDTAAAFVGFWGGPNGVTISADQNETSLSLGGCEQWNCRHLVGSWGVQRRDVLRGSE